MRQREVVVDTDQLKPRYYHELVSKGGRVVLSTWQVDLNSVMALGPVGNRNLALGGMAGLNWRTHRFGLRLAVGSSYFAFDAVDLNIENVSLFSSLCGELFWDLPWLTLGLGGGLAGRLLIQKLQTSEFRTAISPGLLITATVERELSQKLFIRLEQNLRLFFSRQETGLEPVFSPATSLGLGYRFN